MNPSLKGSSTGQIHDSPAQAYFVPVLNLIIKVEKVNLHRYVAHFPDGAERVRIEDMRKDKWERIGPWKEKGELLH